MALVVFLRGVNVGGRNAIRPSELAHELAEFDVVNIGAAGTFVVRKSVGQANLLSEILARLSYEPELMICRSSEVLALAANEPFADAPTDKDVKRYVSVLAKAPKTPPSLPLARPTGDEWHVKVIAIWGRFVLSLHRRLGRKLLYPNEVVEKEFGAATSRNWNTITKICKILEGG